MENSTANNLRTLYAQRKATKNALETLRDNVIRQLAIDLADSGKALTAVEISNIYGLPVHAISTLLAYNFADTHEVYLGSDAWIYITRGKKEIPFYYRQTDVDGNPIGSIFTCNKKVCVYRAYRK